LLEQKVPLKHDFNGTSRILEWWSGWVYAYTTFWLDAGSDWDEQKVAQFLELGGQ
jgi:hypothetical protein